MKPRCTEKTEMETFAMPEPLVSIIVPAYNAAGCIARCVESIVSQSYQELEILLLNDGSRDDTLAIWPEASTSSSRTVTTICCRAARQTLWQLPGAAVPTLCWPPTG